jgi:GGDEF domain-containing protein
LLELRQLVTAMNRLSARMQSMYGGQIQLTERLHAAANTDSVTGVANRGCFDAAVDAALSDDESPHNIAIVLIQIGNFGDVNARFGRDAGDQLLVGRISQLNARFRRRRARRAA